MRHADRRPGARPANGRRDRAASGITALAGLVASGGHIPGRGRKRLELLSTLNDERGPFVTVSQDVSRLDTSDTHPLEPRWDAAVRDVTQQGADPRTPEVVGERMLFRTDRPGRIGRHAVARGDRVLLDGVLPEPPPRDEARYGAVPHLLPLLHSLETSVPDAVVRLDRLGADVEVVGLLGKTTERESVQGTKDVATSSARRVVAPQVPAARRGLLAGNASQVAHELEELLRQRHPRLVLALDDLQAW